MAVLSSSGSPLAEQLLRHRLTGRARASTTFTAGLAGSMIDASASVEHDLANRRARRAGRSRVLRRSGGKQSCATRASARRRSRVPRRVAGPALVSPPARVAYAGLCLAVLRAAALCDLVEAADEGSTVLDENISLIIFGSFASFFGLCCIVTYCCRRGSRKSCGGRCSSKKPSAAYTTIDPFRLHHPMVVEYPGELNRAEDKGILAEVLANQKFEPVTDDHAEVQPNVEFSWIPEGHALLFQPGTHFTHDGVDGKTHLPELTVQGDKPLSPPVDSADIEAYFEVNILQLRKPLEHDYEAGETPKHFYEKNSWLSIGLATRPHKPAVFVGSAGEEYGIALHSNGMLVASELPKKERDAYRLVPRDLRAGDVVGVGYRVEQLLPGEFDTGEDSDVPDALQRSTPSERKKVKQARSKAAPEDCIRFYFTLNGLELPKLPPKIGTIRMSRVNQLLDRRRAGKSYTVTRDILAAGVAYPTISCRAMYAVRVSVRFRGPYKFRRGYGRGKLTPVAGRGAAALVAGTGGQWARDIETGNGGGKGDRRSVVTDAVSSPLASPLASGNSFGTVTPSPYPNVLKSGGRRKKSTPKRQLISANDLMGGVAELDPALAAVAGGTLKGRGSLVNKKRRSSAANTSGGYGAPRRAGAPRRKSSAIPGARRPGSATGGARRPGSGAGRRPARRSISGPHGSSSSPAKRGRTKRARSFG